MKIIVLNGSPRANGNTELLSEAFIKGALDAGNEAELINLRGKKIAGCLGCKYCHGHGGECVQKDDMAGILEALDQADMVVFASPIYWFDMTAQLKVVIDRMYAYGKKGYHFTKTALILDSGADHVYEAAVSQYKMMTGYLGWQDMGIVTAPNLTEKGAVKDTEAMEEAYKLGAALK